MANTVVQNAYSRVFVIEGQAGPNHAPGYKSCMKMAGITQSYGDITRIECPDPYQYGSFVEVAQIRGATGRPTTSLQGRYYMDLLSQLLALATQGCPVDVQLHIGSATDPSQFNTFQKSIILEEAYITSFKTDDLGGLQSGDNAVVNETADISANSAYEVRPLTFAEKAASIITNEITDIIVADTIDCGTTGSAQSDGTQKIFACTKAAGGSPSTPADIVYTVDGGSTWYAYDINTMSAANDASGLAQVGTYIVVVSNAEGAYFHSPKSSFDGGVTQPAFTKVAMPSSGKPNAIFSLGQIAYVVGDGGYIWKIQDATSGATTVEAASVVSDKLTAVHAISPENAVAVGYNGAVLYTVNGTNWARSTRLPVGVGVNLTCVWMRTAYEWWVGTSVGTLYYTINSGTTWTLKSFTGSGAGSVYDIQFPKKSVGYLGVANGSTKGVIHRSYDGGYSWIVLPEGSGSMPSCQKIECLATTPVDANFVVGGGLGAATDGIIVLGTAS